MINNLSTAQLIKAKSFRQLHKNPETFILPCAWDALSAIIFQELGFKCIGTTSGGVNWSQGRQDYVYSVPRHEMLDRYSAISHATSLPVSADLENGYGDSPCDVAATIKESIHLGMVGGSIEDQSMDANGQLYDIQLSIERIQAAREAANSIGLEYTLTARCEAYSASLPKPYAETVLRLNHYYEAGADCLFAPDLSDIDTLRRLVKDVEGPISFGMGASKQPLSLSLLSDIGIRRISTGGGIPRAAFSYIRSITNKIINSGSFDYLDNAISDSEINKYLKTHYHSPD